MNVLYLHVGTKASELSKKIIDFVWNGRIG